MGAERVWILEPELPERVIGYVGPAPEGQATAFLYREFVPAEHADALAEVAKGLSDFIETKADAGPCPHPECGVQPDQPHAHDCVVADLLFKADQALTHHRQATHASTGKGRE